MSGPLICTSIAARDPKFRIFAVRSAGWNVNSVRTRLQQVLEDHPELRGIHRITLLRSLNCLRLQLWDEEGRRLVSFRQARELASDPQQVPVPVPAE